MKRLTTGTELELATDGTGGGGGTVDQGAAGTDPWPVLASIDTTGLALESKQDVGNTSLASIDGKLTNPLPVSAGSLPLPTGAATSVNQASELVLIGAVNEAAPGTDTASSGLNGRLQRIAQRITSLITALGSPFQAGGSIGNSSFGATQATAASLNMTEASAASILSVLGITTGAKVITDATGTIQQYLRGLIYLAVTAGAFLVTAALSTGTNVIGGIRRAGYQNAIWVTSHFPAANTQATITKASAGGGVKNVCIGFTATIASSSTTAPAAIQLTVKLIDGASGGGTILWGTVISLPAVAGSLVSIVRSSCYIPGTAATAMTIEFSAAGGANTIESVSIEGTTE